MKNWHDIETSISAATSKEFTVNHARSIGGGSINSAFILEGSEDSFFVKLNSRALSEMFTAEAEGLRELAMAKAIHVPEVICWGDTSTQTYLVLEYVHLMPAAHASAKQLGIDLANLHQKSAKQFGWFRNNTIGSTPQINTWDSDWVSFFQKNRLAYQLTLAKQNGCGAELFDLGQHLCENLSLFFSAYQPEPSLLHGDLWSGNYGYNAQGSPVIFDPAVYYGDREADIAMTELFGGFSRDFYASYNEVCPLDESYSTRKEVYNLYHVLNHYNLFGGGYQQQSVSIMKKLLSEINP